MSTEPTSDEERNAPSATEHAAARTAAFHSKTDPSQWTPSSTWDNAAQIAAGRRRAQVAATANQIDPPFPPQSHDVLITSPLEQPRGVPPVLMQGTVDLTADIGAPVEVSTRSSIAASARAELSLSPEPVLIVPTPYPDDPTAPLVVHGALVIDNRSEAYREFNAKFDALLGELQKSNEIAGEFRDQILAELIAGRALLAAPKPDRKWIDVFLVRPLKVLAVAAGSAVAGTLAVDALNALMHLLSSGPALPV